MDHIITNSSPGFSKAGILVADISDHLPIFGFMGLVDKPCRKKFKNTFRRNFHVSKKEKFVECLAERFSKEDLNIEPNALLDKIILCIQDTTNLESPHTTTENFCVPWMI